MSDATDAGFDPFVYQGRIERVVDGDTFEATIDLGFDIRSAETVRLHGVDTREVHGVAHGTEEYRRGSEHRAFVEDWFTQNASVDSEWPFVVYSFDDSHGKYGRLLADFAPRDEPTALLSDALLEEFDDVEQY